MSQTAAKVEIVERFFASFDHRWSSEEELAAVLSPEAHFSKRLNLLNPNGSERDAAAMRAGIERGREFLAWQAYEVRDHVVRGDTSSRGCSGAANWPSTRDLGAARV